MSVCVSRPHLYRSAIFLSFPCQLESGSHLYRSTIFLSFCVHFEFSGPHLYRSVIILSVWVCILGPHPYRSAIFLSVYAQFESGPHPYQSVIVLLDWVESCSILSHHLSLVLAFRDIIHINSGTLSHHLSVFLTFRVISPQLCHLESQFLAFISTGIAHLTFMVLHSSSVFLTSLPCAYHIFIV